MHVSLSVRLLLVMLLCVYGNSGQAQEKYTIKGVVQDSMQNKPLGGATINLYAISNRKNAIFSATTLVDGKFVLTVKDTGTYWIEVSFSGYQPKQLQVEVKALAVTEVLFDLVAAASSLKGVTVTAQQKLIEQTEDKIVYNVENDPLARSQSAIDILRRTPFISVDGNNNVRLNGQTNFRVLLNGRETAMFAQNVNDALQGFPGATILKIEVITNPSAKYDAEGIGGIINIITKKKIEGYNGSVSSWNTSINQHIFNTNFNAKMGKVGLALNYGTRSSIDMPSSSTIETLPYDVSFYRSRLLQGDRKFNSFWNFGNAELSWAMDSLSTLSFYGNVSGGNSKVLLDQQVTTDLTNRVAPVVSDFDQINRRRYPTHTIGTDLIKKYKNDPAREFSFRINAELGKNNSFLESVETTPSFSRFIINNSEANNRQYTVQSDYIHPLSKGARLEVGARATLRRAASDFESLIKYSNAENYKQNPTNTDNFHFYQDVYSAYGSYNFKLKAYSFRAGLRVEHTSIDGNFQSAKAFAKNSYVNILPNFQASRKIKDLALVLSYNQRLQRPDISRLNPFIDNNDSLNIFFGNPDLDAQTIHTLMLQSRLQKGKTFMALTFAGSYSNNMIVTLISFNPNNGVRSSTYENVGRDFLFSANGNINTKFGTNWQFNANINFQFRTLRNKLMTSQHNSGIGGNTSAGITYTFNKRLILNNYIGFEQSIIDLQSKPNTIPFCGTGLNYSLIENKLRIGLMGQNYFAKYYDYINYITGTTFETTHTNRNLMGKMVLTVNWNFGKLKEQTSKKKGVTNDDQL
jgi:hypothetical protein